MMSKKSIVAILIFAVFFAFTGYQAQAGEFKAVMKDSKVGQEIHVLYHKASEFASKEDLKGVMGLYSKKYMSDGWDKDYMEASWTQIFGAFDEIEIEHHIYQLFVKGDRAKMICGGAFLGIDTVGSSGLFGSEQESTIIDSWGSATHDLIKEDGVWKIYGNQVPYQTGLKRGPLF